MSKSIFTTWANLESSYGRPEDFEVCALACSGERNCGLSKTTFRPLISRPLKKSKTMSCTCPAGKVS